MKISRANAAHMTSLTKRNITGTTGCQLGLLIPNWTHSDWQLCLGWLNTGVFPLLAAIFPQEDKGQTSTSLPGHKVSTGGTWGCRGKLSHSQTTFWPPALEKVSTVCQALQTAQTLRKLQYLILLPIGKLVSLHKLSENRTHLCWGRIFCLVIIKVQS